MNPISFSESPEIFPTPIVPFSGILIGVISSFSTEVTFALTSQLVSSIEASRLNIAS
ncbi:hypothetical protein ES703_121825 [subsurface metagenome]